MTRRPAPPAELAALLADGADGALADMAAIQLLTSHHYWLTRAFTDRGLSCTRRPPSPLLAASRTRLPTVPGTSVTFA